MFNGWKRDTPRKQFDWLLFRRCSEIVRDAGGAVIQGADVREVFVDKKRITGVSCRIGGRKGTMYDYHSDWTIGAGGYLCPVAKTVVKNVHGKEMVNLSHYCRGYREYWTGVKGCEGDAGEKFISLIV